MCPKLSKVCTSSLTNSLHLANKCFFLCLIGFSPGMTNKQWQMTSQLTLGMSSSPQANTTWYSINTLISLLWRSSKSPLHILIKRSGVSGLTRHLWYPRYVLVAPFFLSHVLAQLCNLPNNPDRMPLDLSRVIVSYWPFVSSYYPKPIRGEEFHVGVFISQKLFRLTELNFN